MTEVQRSYTERTLAVTFLLFAFTSTFSIAVSQMMLGLSLALFIVLMILQKTNPFTGSMKLFYITAAVWVGWLLFTAVLGKTPTRSMWLCREEWLFSIIPIGVVLLRSSEMRTRVLYALAAGVMLISVYCYIMYFTGWAGLSSYDPGPAPGFGWRVAGTFSHRMTFGNYYAVASCLLFGFGLGAFGSLELRQRWFLLGAASMGAVATALSFGRGPIAAMAMTVFLLVLYLGRRLRWLSLAIGLVGVALFVLVPGIGDRYINEFSRDFGGEYEGGRVFIWKNSLKVVRDHPVFGTGQGNFQEEYVSHLRPDIPQYRRLTHAHNDFLNVAAISGIPGMLLFVSFWLVVFRYLWIGLKRRRGRETVETGLLLAALAGSVCFLGSSLFEATFVDEEVRALLMFVWSLGLAVRYNEQDGAAADAQTS